MPVVTLVCVIFSLLRRADIVRKSTNGRWNLHSSGFRSFVASLAVRDLLLSAKYLFVTANRLRRAEQFLAFYHVQCGNSRGSLRRSPTFLAIRLRNCAT
jgi:hypothetical protein